MKLFSQVLRSLPKAGIASWPAVLLLAGCIPPGPEAEFKALADSARQGNDHRVDRQVAELVKSGDSTRTYAESGLAAGDKYRRATSARVLVEIDPGDRSAVSPLLSAADDKNATLRRLSAEGLGLAMPPDEKQLQALYLLSQDDRSEVAEAARQSLRRHGGATARWALSRLELDAGAAEVLPLVPDETVEAVLLWCAAGEGLRHVMRSRLLLNQMTQWLGPAAVPALVESLSSNDPVIGALAARTLEIYEREGNPQVQAEAGRALARYRAAQPAALNQQDDDTL